MEANDGAVQRGQDEVRPASDSAPKAQDDVGIKAPKQKARIVPIAIIAVVAVAVVAAIAIVAPGSNKITKADYVTSSMLQETIEIDNLSTAEFVYNGIAEHYRGEDENPNPLFFWEGDEPVDYRIYYRATVKASVSMKDIGFKVDDAAKTVSVSLPPIMLTSTVNPESMQFIPESADADMQSIFAICEEDVELEAQESQQLHETAEENLRSVVEALTLPILSANGYSLVWDEGE